MYFLWMKSRSGSVGVTSAIPGPLELLGVEGRAHGEAGTEQAHLFQAERLGPLCRGFHDAEQRNHRPLPDLFKYEVGRIRSDEAEVRPSIRQRLHTDR